MAAERPRKAREAIHPASCMSTVLSHSAGGLGGGGGGPRIDPKLCMTSLVALSRDWAGGALA